MCFYISENYVIPDVTGGFLFSRQVKDKEYADLSGFDTRVLSRLGCVLFCDVLSVTISFFNFQFNNHSTIPDICDTPGLTCMFLYFLTELKSKVP